MTTRPYEALVILKTAGTEQEIARSASMLEEPVKKIGGRIEGLHGLGRRKLAFRIARQTEGYYYVLRFHAPTEQIPELDRLLRLNDAIVRFMILSADEVPVAAAEQAASARPAAPASRSL